MHTSTTSSTALAGNVLIRSSDGAVKLTDFGLACRAGERAPKFGGGVAGTYGYIAPEVLRGEAVTSLSDPYLLGALAYRLLAGPPEPRRAVTADEVGAVHWPAAGRRVARAAGRCGGGGRLRAGV